MELSEKQKQIVKKVLNIENLEIVPCLEEAAIVGLGVGLFTSLFYGFKTGCKVGAVAGGFHAASKIITAEVFLNILRPAESLALMSVIGSASSSSIIPPYIVKEIIAVIKQLAEKHGLSVVKAMTA